MRKCNGKLLVLLPFVVGALGCQGANDAIGSQTSTSALNVDDGDLPLDHIFYIMMENHATDEIIGNVADAR